MNNIALDVGGVFLLVALVMFASKSGLLPKARAGKLAGAIAGVLIFSAAAYNFGPDLYARAQAQAMFHPVTPSAAVPAIREPSAPPPVKVHAPPPAEKPQHWTTTLVVEAPEPQHEIQAPPVEEKAETSIAEPDPEPDSTTGGRPKRVIKSIGRALHIGKRK